MEEQNKSNSLAYRGYLKGHGGWVTSLAVGEGEFDGENKEYLMSASRDKTMIRWDLDPKKDTDEDKEWGKPRKLYTGKYMINIHVWRVYSRTLTYNLM